MPTWDGNNAIGPYLMNGRCTSVTMRDPESANMGWEQCDWPLFDEWEVYECDNGEIPITGTRGPWI